MADSGYDQPSEEQHADAERPEPTHKERVTPQQPLQEDEETERELWSGRPSLKFFYGRVILLVVLVIALPMLGFWLRSVAQANWPLWVALVLLALALVFLLLRSCIFIWSYRFRVTTKRLFIEEGLLSKTSNQTDLIRVNDVSVTQTLFGRIFNVGTVSVDCPTDVSHPKVLIIGVEDPHSVAEHIHREMRAIRDRRALMMEQT